MSRTRRQHFKWFWISEEKSGRDKKPRNKPNRSWKSMTKEIRRAKEHQAMRDGNYEAMLLFKKANEYHYT